MNSTLSGWFYRFCGGFDICFNRSCQTTDGGAIFCSHCLGNLLNRLKISWASKGETRFDDINSQTSQLPRNHQLLVYIQGRSRALFPIPERGVKDYDTVRLQLLIHSSVCRHSRVARPQSILDTRYFLLNY